MKSFFVSLAILALTLALCHDANAQYGRGGAQAFTQRGAQARSFAPTRFQQTRFFDTGYNQTRAFVFTQPTYAPAIEVVQPTFVTQPATVTQPTYQTQPATTVIAQQPTYPAQPATTVFSAPVYSTPAVIRTTGVTYGHGFSQPQFFFVQGRGFVRVR